MQRTGRFIISTAIVFAVMTQTIFADILKAGIYGQRFLSVY